MRYRYSTVHHISGEGEGTRGEERDEEEARVNTLAKGTRDLTRERERDARPVARSRLVRARAPAESAD